MGNELTPRDHEIARRKINAGKFRATKAAIRREKEGGREGAEGIKREYIAFSRVVRLGFVYRLRSAPISYHPPASYSRPHVCTTRSDTPFRIHVYCGKVAASFCSIVCAISRCPERHSLQTAFIGFIGSVSSPVCSSWASPRKMLPIRPTGFHYVMLHAVAFLSSSPSF